MPVQHVYLIVQMKPSLFPEWSYLAVAEAATTQGDSVRLARRDLRFFRQNDLDQALLPHRLPEVRPLLFDALCRIAGKACEHAALLAGLTADIAVPAPRGVEFEHRQSAGGNDL